MPLQSELSESRKLLECRDGLAVLGHSLQVEKAVIDCIRGTSRFSDRHEQLLTDALKKCRGALMPGGKVSLVFGGR